KWLGCIASVRLAWVWLGLIWMSAAVVGGLSVAAVPMLIAAWLIYAGVFAAVGLWFSLVSRTTLRATVWTLLSTIGLAVGHWLVSIMLCYIPVSMMGNSSSQDVEYLVEFQVGQTPPAVLVILTFRGDELSGRAGWSRFMEFFGFSILGLG